MKRVACALGLLAFLNSAHLAPQADAQVTEAISGLATGELIRQIGDSLNGLIDNARESGDFLGMRASQEALYVLDAFKQTNTELLDTTFDKIGKERQAILNSLRETVAQIETGRVDTLDRLQATGDQLDRLARDVAFKEFPILYRYRGTVITPRQQSEVRLTVDGHRLTRGEPHLIFRGKKYAARIEGESLRFELPRSLFSEDLSQPKFENASLVVENREGGFFGYFQTITPKSYDLSFVTLPREVGAVSVSFQEIVDVPHERPFQEEVAFNSSSRSWKCQPFAYSPGAADRRFDPDRSSVTKGSGDSRGEIRHVRVRDVGISFEICAKRSLWDKSNGFRHAIVRYVEVWKTQASQERSASAKLLWTESMTISVPARRSGLAIAVTDFTGVSRTVTEAGGAAGKYAKVRVDAQSDLIVVDPILPAFVSAL